MSPLVDRAGDLNRASCASPETQTARGRVPGARARRRFPTHHHKRLLT